jgi:hypothetical protein
VFEAVSLPDWFDLFLTPVQAGCIGAGPERRKLAAMSRLVLAGALVLLAGAATAAADPRGEVRRTPFDQGRVNFGLGGGTQSSLGFRYFVIGAAGGYFVLDGLELGLGAAHYFGDGPSISRVTPAMRYVAQPLVGHSPLVPYAGVFYSHWFVGAGLADVDAVGARAGLLHVSGSVILGLGVAFERIVSACSGDCLVIYPDLTLAFAF